MGAVVEIVQALRARGFEYGEPVLNMPPEALPESLCRDEDLYKIDLSFARPGDLLLQMTRPPLSDQDEGDRKKVLRGYTNVEKALFNAWEEVFEVCSRKHVKLAAPIWAKLAQGFRDRKDIEFYESQAAPYKELNALDGKGWHPLKADSDRTAAFLLYVKEAWRGGPGFLGAFGMDGTSTLVWAYRLARDFAHLLLVPGFTFVEIECGEIPQRATDLTWAEDWHIEIIAEYRDKLPLDLVPEFPGASSPAPAARRRGK
jgi:hypothetical protein